jgi:hypothetical protein
VLDGGPARGSIPGLNERKPAQAGSSDDRAPFRGLTFIQPGDSSPGGGALEHALVADTCLPASTRIHALRVQTDKTWVKVSLTKEALLGEVETPGRKPPVVPLGKGDGSWPIQPALLPVRSLRMSRKCIVTKRDMRAGLIAVCVMMVLTAACSGHRHIAGTAEDLGDLRVALDATAGLRRCRYVTGSQHITIDLGERANEQIERALDEVFTLDDGGEAAPNMIAIPRIASVNVTQEGEFGRIDATITYAVWFQTPAGEPVTEVTGTGSGSSDYPGLINLARMLFHLGTLFLFEGIDVGRQYRSAMHEAQADAQDALVGALQRSPELRQYVATARGTQRIQTRDAALESLLDSVIAGRAMAIAVLDLQPIAGQPAAVESYLAEEIRTRLAQRRGVRTFERALLAHALEELQLGMSDLADPEHVRRFGRMVAADAILTGTTMHFPHDIKLMLRALDTETGEVIGAGSTMLRLGSGLPGGGGMRTDPGPACP